MRIVIDMQGAQTESRFRGIGRYVLALTQALVRNRGEHEIILALNGLFDETIQPIRDTFAIFYLRATSGFGKHLDLFEDAIRKMPRATKLERN